MTNAEPGSDRILRRRLFGKAAKATIAWALTEAVPFHPLNMAYGAPPSSLRVADIADIYSTDTYMSLATSQWYVLSQIFDPLVHIDRTGKWQGTVAERWEIVNPTSVRFHLRRGIKFHNGDPLTSEDVKFTFNHITDPSLKAPMASYFAPLESVTADDDYTVTIKTKQPYAPLLAILYNFFVFPASYFTKVGEAGFVKAPIGSGPYRFLDWEKDIHVSMEAFPGHWRGSPRIQRLTYQPIPEDSARLGALQNSEVDFIHRLPVDQVQSLKGNSAIRVEHRPGQIVYIGLNTLTYAPFKDRRVRQALNHATNVDSIVKNLFQNLAVRQNGAFFTVTPGYDRSLSPYPYDPAKARQLLRDAGYANGFDVTLTVPSPWDAQLIAQVAQAIANDLARVGVQAKVKLEDGATMSAEYTARKLDMYLYTWVSSPESGRHIGTLFQSDVRGYYYRSEDADNLIRPYLAELDPQKRAPIGRRLNQFLHDDAPWVFLYQEPDLYAMRSNVRWTPNPYDYITHVNDIMVS